MIATNPSLHKTQPQFAISRTKALALGRRLKNINEIYYDCEIQVKRARIYDLLPINVAVCTSAFRLRRKIKFHFLRNVVLNFPSLCSR